MEDELDILDSEEGLPFDGKRPVFITVLAILTFVGSGIILIKDIMMYAAFSMAENFANIAQKSDLEYQLANAFKWMQICYIMEFVSCIITVAGAIMMMGLRKFGFYLYVFGNFLFAAEVIWFYTVATQYNINEFSVFFMVFQLFIPVGFVILYGVNFKYLRR